MKIMGMNYCISKKNYYVDGNELKDAINARWRFVKNYLTNKLLVYRWVKLPLKEEIRLNIDSGGYKYVLTEDGSSMVKFNVDVHRSFQDTMYLTEFCGN